MAYTCANHWRQSGDGVANFGLGLSYFGHGVVWAWRPSYAVNTLLTTPVHYQIGLPPAR